LLGGGHNRAAQRVVAFVGSLRIALVVKFSNSNVLGHFDGCEQGAVNATQCVPVATISSHEPCGQTDGLNAKVRFSEMS
jgi:hypothetical protein